MDKETRTCFDASALTDYDGSAGLASRRKAIFCDLITENNSGFIAAPMVVTLREPYQGHLPVKLNFPNGGPCDEIPAFKNWLLMRHIFKSVSVGQSCHFLCVQDLTAPRGKIRYIPILLVEVLDDDDDASSYSKTLRKIAERSDKEYLSVALERNAEFVTSLDL
jgi:hypothetical protein